MKEKEELLFELEHGEKELEHGKEVELNFEHGDLSLEEALEQLAKATGKTPEETAALWKLGCEKGEKADELAEAREDTAVFEQLAEIRGISKKEMREEILWALEKANTEKLIAEICEANPGMNRKTAEELARFRLEAAKGKKNEEPKEDWGLKLKELDEFLALHKGEALEKLAAEVVEQWEGGLPLEEAFTKHRLGKENAKLLEEIEAMKAAKLLEEQKAYAKKNSPGSAVSSAESARMDDFVAGLFREY